MKEMIIIIIILYSLFKFAIDYLSNSLITHNELSIGIVTLLHHISLTTLNFFPLILFTNINKGVLLFLLFNMIISEIMWIINKDHCWLTMFQNTLIKEEYRYYKWIGDVDGFIKKYIRGDEWAYSNIQNNNKKNKIIMGNGILILYCLKMIFINVN